MVGLWWVLVACGGPAELPRPNDPPAWPMRDLREPANADAEDGNDGTPALDNEEAAAAGVGSDAGSEAEPPPSIPAETPKPDPSGEAKPSEGAPKQAQPAPDPETPSPSEP